MFQFLKEKIEDWKYQSGPNEFYAVSKTEIDEAEKRLGFHLPAQLTSFLLEIGCGFLKSASNEQRDEGFNFVNRFLAPDEIADLFLGEGAEGLIVPSEGFAKGALPFFEVGDGLYIVVHPVEDHPDQICWPDGKPIAPDLVTFVHSLMANPRFYHE